MVESTADDHLTVDGDAMFVVGADPEHAVRVPLYMYLAAAAAVITVEIYHSSPKERSPVLAPDHL